MTIPILKTKTDIDKWRNEQKNDIHFVPTMGGLHLGHSHLIKEASKEKSTKPPSVLVSIFVNPLQFSPDEDFEQYPRDLINDSSIAQKAGADAIWAPNFKDVFPREKEGHFTINVPEQLQAHLCGAKRKGHFNGVATVLIHLLKVAKPKFLFLGEKDWQQYIIIRKLINDFGLSVKVETIATVRDNNGLALSSRNKYLSQSQLNQAKALPNCLNQALVDFNNRGVINLKEIKSSLEKNDLNVEYLEIVDKSSLSPIDHPESLCLLAAAVRCGNTRLIDHTFLMKRSPIVAIDGPAGAGKSTVTKAFAEKLGLLYLDTGAMYRAVTWFILEEKINPKEDKKIEELLERTKIDLRLDNERDQRVFLNEKDITNLIRDPKVTELVSTIAAKSCVREKLTKQQKLIGKSGGIVAEGRDIGTQVFPDAELKIFLTATAKERAKRRAKDLKEKGYLVPEILDLESQIRERDRLDINRKIAPLIKAKDAKEVITDGMNIDEVVNTLIDLFRIEIPKEVW